MSMVGIRGRHVCDRIVLIPLLRSESWDCMPSLSVLARDPTLPAGYHSVVFSHMGQGQRGGQPRACTDRALRMLPGWPGCRVCRPLVAGAPLLRWRTARNLSSQHHLQTAGDRGIARGAEARSRRSCTFHTNRPGVCVDDPGVRAGRHTGPRCCCWFLRMARKAQPLHFSPPHVRWLCLLGG